MSWWDRLETYALGRHISKVSDLGIGALLLILALSVAAAFIAAWMYVRFYGRRGTGTQIHRAFPLLGLSIAAIFVCVQFSLALSLGLLGALSIVRFRTPIKEPEEIGFLMLVIASSIACATFNLLFLVAVLAIAFVTLWFLNSGLGFCRPCDGIGSVVLRMPEADYRRDGAGVFALVKKRLPDAEVESVSMDGATSLVSYMVRHLAPEDLAQLESELRTLVPGCGVNAFFNRADRLL